MTAQVQSNLCERGYPAPNAMMADCLKVPLPETISSSIFPLRANGV
jgi:hypothetical protein